MLIGPPIPEMQLFKKLTLKFQGQGWGQSSKPQSESNILSTHIPLVPCQSAFPFLRYSIFLNLTVKIQGQGHTSRSQSWYITLSTHILFVPCWSTPLFLGYNNFKIWRWKFKVQVMGEVKVESHNMGPTFIQITSLLFHVDRASHCWVKTFSKFYLEIQGPKLWVRSQFKVTMWV